MTRWYCFIVFLLAFITEYTTLHYLGWDAVITFVAGVIFGVLSLVGLFFVHMMDTHWGN